MKQVITSVLIAFLIILNFSCEETPTPKPKGYPRIDIPKRDFKIWSSNCPYQFKISSLAKIEKNTKTSDSCYINLSYDLFNATIHLSYAPINGDLKKLIDQEYKMREKHNAFATKVKERVYHSSDDKVNAMVFDIYGTKSATPLQFFITDSTHHFFRGALYFYNTPNNDSLAPVITHIKQDVDSLIESFNWK